MLPPCALPHGVPGGTGKGGPWALPQGREERGREGEQSARSAPGPTGRLSNPVPPLPQGPPGVRGATAAARAGPGGVVAAAAAAMGWEEKEVRGYPEFVQTAQSYHGRPIFALFCGDKDAEGKSWCPDCVTGEARGGSALPAARAVSVLGKPQRLRVPFQKMPGGHSSPPCRSQALGVVFRGELSGL